MSINLRSVFSENCRFLFLEDLLVADGILKPGQRLEDVPIDRALLLIEDYANQCRRCDDFYAEIGRRAEREEEERKAAKKKAEEEARLAQEQRWAQQQREVEERRVAEAKQRRAYARDRFLSNIPPIYQDLTVEGALRPKQFQYVSQFIPDDQCVQCGGLLLQGPTRTGKTASVWTMLAHLVEKQHVVPEDVLFVASVDFFRAANSKHLSKEDKDAFEEQLDQMLHIGILVMDDVGTEKQLSESSGSAFYKLIDHRHAQKLFTVITTNLSASELTEHFRMNGAKIMGRLTCKKNGLKAINFTKP